MPGWLLLLHKPCCPQFSTPLAMDLFLYAKSRIRASSSTSSNPVTTFFIFSINSSLSPFHALHPPPLRCHILYTSSPPSSNLSISPPPLQLCCTPPPLSFINNLLIFFLFTPTHLALNPTLTSSFNTHSFGCSSNSSAYMVVPFLHAHLFSMYFPSAFDMPFTMFNLTSPHSKSTRHHSKFSRHFTFPFSNSASIDTIFTNLSSPIVITLCQNSIHLVFTSYFKGSNPISICRDVLGGNLPTPRNIL